MKNLCVIIALIIIITARDICGLTYNARRKIDYLKYKGRSLYGDETVGEMKPLHYVNAELDYPRGDIQKLALISRQWCNYYDCLARLRDSLTASHVLPSTILMVYEGGVARLPCDLCVAPDEGPALTWTYAESSHNLTFHTMEDKDRTVWEEDNNLTIYHVRAEDAGVYRCELGRSVGGLTVLEIVDDENYTVVKQSSTRGPYAAPPMTLNDSLTTFSSWSRWSECSACARVGRRRRYGLCYVKLYRPYYHFDFHQITMRLRGQATDKDTNSTNAYHKKNIFNDATLALFEAFPNGVPCRSRYLPHAIRRIPAVMHRPSEIMIAMCKVKCKDKIFELRSNTGQVLERANNTAGVYSLSQWLPKQPPSPARDTIFADYGQSFVIRCPGTTLRDVSITWRIGTRRVAPRQLDAASAGRVHLNARDHLVLTRVLYGDTDLYSCWQWDAVAGGVQLAVWAGWSQHAALALLAVAAAALHAAARILRNKRHGRT